MDKQKEIREIFMDISVEFRTLRWRFNRHILLFNGYQLQTESYELSTTN